MVEVVLNDRLLFRLVEPMVARYPAVVLIRFAVTASPVGKRRRPQTDPAQQLLGGNLGGLCPFTHIVDDFVAFFMRNPAAT